LISKGFGRHGVEGKITQILLGNGQPVALARLRRFVLLSTLVLSQAFPSHVSARDPIILSTALGMPFVSENGEEGFLSLLAEDVFSRAGLKVEIKRVPEERSLRSANSGFTDGELMRIAGIEQTYPNLIMVPGKTVTMDFVAFVKPSSDIKLNGWNSLRPYSVGIITGWKIYEQNVKNTKARIDVVNLYLLLGLLNNGRVDVIMGSRVSGLYTSQKLGIPIVAVAPPFATHDMHIFMHKRHQKLVPLVAAALADVKKDGTYDRLYKQIFTPLR